MKVIIFSFIISVLPVFIQGFPNVYKNLETIQNQIKIGLVGDPLILTPLIQRGLYLEAQRQAKVSLPGAESLKSYSGYFTVDERFNSNLFFWFFPASDVDSSEAPVILWLQGGPGASSLTGLFKENGPLEFKNGEKVPTLRQCSWAKTHNVIYIDNPVGTGYSFTNDGYCQNQTIVGEHLYAALTQFFKMFPDLQDNDFFITGESYAGKYVPQISHTILKNNDQADLKLNLKGLAIGNGLSDPEHQLIYSDYLYQLGLIDLNITNQMKTYETLGIQYIREGKWKEATNIFEVLINGDFIDFPTLFKNTTGLDDYFNYLHTPCKKTYLEYSYADYVNRDEIRVALHVGNTPFGDDNVKSSLAEDIMKSVAPLIAELLNHYRVLFYTGQLDIIFSYPTTENFLRNLNFSSANDYATAQRQIWKVKDEVAGYLKKAGNLTEVLVRNAGHMVPYDQPKWALDLITKFIKNKLS